MIQKIVYGSIRKESTDVNFFKKKTNLFQKHALKYFCSDNLYKNKKFVSKFFQVKKKKPTRVVLKAPFHYKKGKHLLTLINYRYVKLNKISLGRSKVPMGILDFIGKTKGILRFLPTNSEILLQQKYTKIYISDVIDKSFFKF